MEDKIYFEKIEKILTSRGISMPELYKFVGYSRQSSKNYQTQGYIPPKYATKIAEFLGVNISFLFGEEKVDSASDIQSYFDTNKIIASPLYSSKIEDGEYLVKVESSVMYPTLEEDDIVWCRHDANIRIADNLIVHYEYGDNMGIARIKIDEETDLISLVPDNIKEYKIITIPINNQNHLKISKIIGVLSSLNN